MFKNDGLAEEGDVSFLFFPVNTQNPTFFLVTTYFSLVFLSIKIVDFVGVGGGVTEGGGFMRI
jgi:hypothetical protein